MTFDVANDPAKLTGDAAVFTTWADTNTGWPLDRTMAQWIAKVPLGSKAKENWDKFIKRPSQRNLEVAVANLKKHIEDTYEAELTMEELAEKDRLIDELIQEVEPDKLEVYNPDDYADALIAKVNNEARCLQSLKGKDPYVESQQDDEVSTTSLSARRIRARVAVIRPQVTFYNELTPGKNLDWEDWRKDDCVFAAILKVVLKDKAPTEEEKDEDMATTLAGHLKLGKGPVADPVILFLMKRLGWGHTTYAKWADFQTQATQGSTYVLSVDVSFSGTKSHVVVATYSGGWTIYDRQGNRLGLAISEPSYADNPLDAWKFAETDAVSAIRGLFN